MSFDASSAAPRGMDRSDSSTCRWNEPRSTGSSTFTKRAGEDPGLFPDTEDGERSRRFIRRLTELEAEAGAGARLLLTEVAVGDRVIASTVAFDDGVTCYFYNAGLDPSARELSPGVVATAMLIRDRLAAGRQRFDFLRGDERYKYEWGAVDEVIERIVVRKGG